MGVCHFFTKLVAMATSLEARDIGKRGPDRSSADKTLSLSENRYGDNCSLSDHLKKRKQEAFYIAIHQVSLLSHAACAIDVHNNDNNVNA